MPIDSEARSADQCEARSAERWQHAKRKPVAKRKAPTGSDATTIQETGRNFVLLTANAVVPCARRKWRIINAMKDPADGLEVYLVGGAVRDRLLGLEVRDRDWAVVGVTPAQMLERGFKPVGEDFPVFLHPQSGEQYALARRERKTAKGYRGFEVISDPDITLEQDLQRRDLTINAIAMHADGTLVDPFGGAADIGRRVLRHVSPAFSEDPVRVLRVARFKARFHEIGFSVHPDTRALMAQMAAAGEVDALQPERVWQELHGALATTGTARFIEELRRCGALAKVLPEVDALFGVPQPAEHHPEIDTGLHLLLSLDAAHRLSDDPKVIFAVLTHDLGKALTPKNALPAHHGHEKSGLPLVEAICRRLRAPEKYRKLALSVCEYHLHHHRIAELKPATLLTVLERLDGFRQPNNVRRFTLACIADLRGRTGREELHCPQSALLERYHHAALAVDAAAVAEACSDGAKIKKALRRQRIAALASVKKQSESAHRPENRTNG